MGTSECKKCKLAVDRSTENILYEIGARGKNQEEKLLEAQKELVNSVCESCWPEGLNKILWVQAYVQLEEKTLYRLSGGIQEVETDWYLHHAANIAMSDEDANLLYKNTLIPKLKIREEELKRANPTKIVSLTKILSMPDSPKILQINYANGEFKCRPNHLDIDPLYACLFQGKRSTGEYIHIACEDQVRKLSPQLGPAGIYLFMSERNYEINNCLINRLGQFIGKIAEAQLIAAGKHLMDQVAIGWRLGIKKNEITITPSKTPPDECLHFIRYVSKNLENGIHHSDKILGDIEFAATHDEPVLILGETGSGKESVANAIHERWKQKNGFEQSQITAINCAALVPSLARSELFGHVHGAFNQAVENKGRIRAAYEASLPALKVGSRTPQVQADNKPRGTLFLDEFGDLDIETQAALLRYLQTFEVQPVGGVKIIPNQHLRIIAATSDPKVAEFAFIQLHRNRRSDKDRNDEFRGDLIHRIMYQTIHVEGITSKNVNDSIRFLLRNKKIEWEEEAIEYFGEVIKHKIEKIENKDKYPKAQGWSFGHWRELIRVINLSDACFNHWQKKFDQTEAGQITKDIVERFCLVPKENGVLSPLNDVGQNVVLAGQEPNSTELESINPDPIAGRGVGKAVRDLLNLKAAALTSSHRRANPSSLDIWRIYSGEKTLKLCDKARTRIANLFLSDTEASIEALKDSDDLLWLAVDCIKRRPTKMINQVLRPLSQQNGQLRRINDLLSKKEGKGWPRILEGA